MSTSTPTTWTPTRTTPTPDSALSLAIAPVAAEVFERDHWEREPLHVPRDEPRRFDHLLSAADAERLITEPGLRYPGFRLVKAGARLAPGGYTTDLSWRPVPFAGTADVERILAEFEGGATIVLQALHLQRVSVALYCRELEARLGHPVQANAYLTPRCSQGLPVHHDTHDVFVLQVSGSKRWLVYEPVLELPLKHQRYRPALGRPGAAVLDVVLRPGDALYLPRGWLHEALTSDADSLHLTVGVNVHTWIDAFRAALERCEHEVAFRRAAEDGSAAEALVHRLAAELDPARVATARRQRLLRGRRPVLDGQLGQLRALDALDVDSVVERRPAVLAECIATDGHVELAFDGKRIRLPSRAAAAVGLLVETGTPVRVSDLPGLDDSGRLVLVRRLVREGFLRTVS
ncbi:MAG: cupin [Thermoleophilia bacterium]|nr:cupin [Thermoleophilia bacterium]